jgi:hypothetical protein
LLPLSAGGVNYSYLHRYVHWKISYVGIRWSTL